MREVVRDDRDYRPTWFDRVVLAVAPVYGARRIAAQRMLHAGHFARIEAAESNNTRGDRWLISRLSPDSQLEQDLATTRERSRDIYQNDAIGGAVDSKVNHVIGTGHTPQARLRAVDGLLTEPEAEALNESIEEVYRLWSPRADATRRRSLWMLSRIAARHNEFDGESFTILSDVGTADSPIPLAVQVIDPERVETPPKHNGDPSVRLGIRYGANGQIISYFVRGSHPGDTKGQSQEYDEIPAARVLHVFEPWFAEQSRGLPWLTRAMNRAKDAKDVDEAHIIAAQVEACYTAFVRSPAGGYAAAIGATTGTGTSGERLQSLSPGTIQYLGPGEEVSFATPVRPGNGLVPFLEWNYRRVAAAINWPYEMVVKNWNGLSFAAGRLVLTDAKKSTAVGQKMMAEMWLAAVWNRMVEEAVIVGAVEVDPRDFLASPHVFTRHVWIPPRWDYALNPGEEVKADIEEINAGLLTREDALGKRGADLEDFLARRQREMRLERESGLEFASTPARTEPQAPPSSQPTEQPQEAAA